MKNPYSYTQNEMGEAPKEPKCTCKEHDPYCCQVHGICPTCVKKEEFKQECRITKIMQMDAKMAYDSLSKQELTPEEAIENRIKGINVDTGFKQKTLEEAGKKIITNMGWTWENTESSARRVAEYCAKYQQEQDNKLYSYDEVLKILHNIFDVYGKHIDVKFNHDLINDLFNHYKKK